MASAMFCLSTASIIPLSCAVIRNRMRRYHGKVAGRGASTSSYSMAKQNQSSSEPADDTLEQRRSGNYPPTIWEDSFIQSLPIDFKDDEALRQISMLKEEVRHEIRKQDFYHQLELVDELQQLGLSYHFEKDIKEVLTSIYRTIDNAMMVSQYDIYSTSLLFRLLREQGFHISIDIFNRFKDEKGRFNANLGNDTKGMLGLYEASFHKTEGENQMDEARKFAAISLRDLTGSSVNSLLQERVAYALELPLHYRMPRLHNLWFIKMYEREENKNLTLLKMSKLDFNLVQAICKRELKEVSRWWANLELRDTIGFARDRLVENYLWAVGGAYEPKFWRSREAMTKANCLITCIDDIYDVYGSLEELELFTKVVNRWDATAIEELPNYMKICFMALFNTTNDTAYRILKLKGVNPLPHLKKAWADLCEAYLIEARWYHGGYMPTFKEYLDNAWISISGHIILTHAYSTSEDLTNKDFECYIFYPDAVRHSSMILRLCNDLATSTAELERGDVPKSIQCYMHENNVSEAIAREHMRDMIDSIWTELNGECIAGSSFVESFKKVVLNLPRMAQCIYQYDQDGYGISAQESKDTVMALLIEPIQL